VSDTPPADPLYTAQRGLERRRIALTCIVLWLLNSLFSVKLEHSVAETVLIALAGAAISIAVALLIYRMLARRRGGLGKVLIAIVAGNLVAVVLSQLL